MPFHAPTLHALIAGLTSAFCDYRTTYHDFPRTIQSSVLGAVRACAHPAPPNDSYARFVGAMNTRVRALSAHDRLRKHQDEQAIHAQAANLLAHLAPIPLFAHPYLCAKITFHAGHDTTTLAMAVDHFPITPTTVSADRLTDHLLARAHLLAQIPASGPFSPFIVGTGSQPVYAPSLAHAFVKHILLTADPSTRPLLPRILPRHLRATGLADAWDHIQDLMHPLCV